LLKYILAENVKYEHVISVIFCEERVLGKFGGFTSTLESRHYKTKAFSWSHFKTGWLQRHSLCLSAEFLAREATIDIITLLRKKKKVNKYLVISTKSIPTPLRRGRCSLHLETEQPV
jgi:hypothetical protein